MTPSDPVRLVSCEGGAISPNNPLPVSIGGLVPGGLPLPISEDWRVALFEDTTPNLSVKNFTVPIATEWQILWIYVSYGSTATVGDRQLEIQVSDAIGNVIATWQVGITQAANLGNNYLIAPLDVRLA